MDDSRPLPRCQHCDRPAAEDERVLALTCFWHRACVPDYMRETKAGIAGDRPERLPELLRDFRLEFSVEKFSLKDSMEEAVRAAWFNVSAVRHLLDGDQDDSPIIVEDVGPLVGTKENPIVIKDDK